MGKQGLGSQYPAGRGAPLGNGGGLVRTFFVTAADAGGVNKVAISVGAISGVAGGTATLATLLLSGVSDGDQVYIDVTGSALGVVSAVTVAAAPAVPAHTTTHGYTLIASISIVSGDTVVEPLAWNYSQVQKCGSTAWIFGGFGE